MIKLISSLNDTAKSNGTHPPRYLNWGGGKQKYLLEDKVFRVQNKAKIKNEQKNNLKRGLAIT